MKKISYIIGLFGAIALLTSCNDGFMERFPKTSITEGGFFNNVTDLQTYIYGLYDDSHLMAVGSYNDDESDDVTFKTSMGDTWQMLYGQLSAETATGWDNWGSLRSVNFFLQNAGKATGNETEINNCIGIARYMRAFFYIRKVQLYSNVPWTDKALGSDDPDVYRVADPREFVVDKIMEDLEFAAANVGEAMGNKTRIHKYSVLALLSRFCLYEGTYRKYHSELGLAASANGFLQRSLSASEEIINSGLFSISTEGVPAEEFAADGGIYVSTAYRALFQSQNLSGNSEVIQWSDFLSPKRNNGADRVKGNDYGLSRALVETYLMKDGTPFTTTVGYATKTFGEIFKNRDPRMAETIGFPGFTAVNTSNPMPTGGGYDQIKF
ncbi:MAG: RagB/SusD family nutrient uptake outer membrane protein, partial [Bacteroidales bacterium]|nr:RagB/SusD family nutrient uptake outer membrane protein [Bacteroidales bacterium]